MRYLHLVWVVPAAYLAGLLLLRWRERGDERYFTRLRLEEEEAARRRVLVVASRRRAEVEEYLVRYREVRVSFLRHPELLVPETVLLVEGEACVLTYGVDSPVPIPDLRTTLEGVYATLSFSRSPCRTFVPWEAVVGVRGYGEPARSWSWSRDGA